MKRSRDIDANALYKLSNPSTPKKRKMSITPRTPSQPEKLDLLRQIKSIFFTNRNSSFSAQEIVSILSSKGVNRNSQTVKILLDELFQKFITASNRSVTPEKYCFRKGVHWDGFSVGDDEKVEYFSKRVLKRSRKKSKDVDYNVQNLQKLKLMCEVETKKGIKKKLWTVKIKNISTNQYEKMILVEYNKDILFNPYIFNNLKKEKIIRGREKDAIISVRSKANKSPFILKTKKHYHEIVNTNNNNVIKKSRLLFKYVEHSAVNIYNVVSSIISDKIEQYKECLSFIAQLVKLIFHVVKNGYFLSHFGVENLFFKMNSSDGSIKRIYIVFDEDFCQHEKGDEENEKNVVLHDCYDRNFKSFVEILTKTLFKFFKNVDKGLFLLSIVELFRCDDKISAYKKTIKLIKKEVKDLSNTINAGNAICLY